MLRAGILIILSFYLAYSPLMANSSQSLASILDGISFSGQWFFHYEYSDISEEKFNEFKLKRGYQSLHKKFNQSVSTRVTYDLAVDQEGDGIGDIEIRLKYGYLKYTFNQFWILTEPLFEFGVVHRPWMDYEEKINRYRVQGTMFLERNDILKSADYGISVISLIGGKIGNEHQKSVNKNYPGKYGSLAFGIYNGGGYEEIERNNNKLCEGRLTIRPFPKFLPGFQLSYLGGYGKGNTEAAPDFYYNAGFIVLENKYMAVTGTYYDGVGDVLGNEVDRNGNSYHQNGYSVFSEVRMFESPLRVYGRYDYFEKQVKTNDWIQNRIITGVSIYFLNSSKLLFDFEYRDWYKSGIQNDKVYKIALEFIY